MNNKLFKGIITFAAGSVAYKVVKERRQRRLEKELYEQDVELDQDEHSAKE